MAEVTSCQLADNRRSMSGMAFGTGEGVNVLLAVGAILAIDNIATRVLGLEVSLALTSPLHALF